MTEKIQLETPRLTLSAVTPALIHELFAKKGQADIQQFFAVDADGYNHLKTMHEKGMETHRISMFYFLLFDKEQQKVIGDCGFHSWNRSHRRAELFYNLRNDSDKRKGFMTEALYEVLLFGFTQLELHRVEALVASYNTASVKLLERFRFSKEGTVREDYVVDGKNEDSDCYSLLKWEWSECNL